jgi:hypothetical protein
MEVWLRFNPVELMNRDKAISAAQAPARRSGLPIGKQSYTIDLEGETEQEWTASKRQYAVLKTTDGKSRP